MKKKLLSFLLAACLLLALLIPAPRTAFAAATSGTDGGIHWEIADGVLTLSAAEGTNGKMNSYSYTVHAPWQDSPRMKDVKTVVIMDGVKELGSMAFYGSGIHLKQMVVPGSVDVIPGLFCHSVTIDTLYINEGVCSLESGAFYGITKTVYLANSVGSLPLSAFGTNNAAGDGTISCVKQIYGYTDSQGQQYAENYLKAIEATLSAVRMWKDGRKYALDSDLDGVADANPKITFTALDKPAVLKKATVTSSVSVSAGKSQKLKVSVPSHLTLVTKYSGMEGEVKASFKSKNSKIAAVDKNGKITGKKKGTTMVTTTLKLKNGTKKTFTTKVTVK